MHIVLAAILLLAAPPPRPQIYPMPLTRIEAEAVVDSLARDYVEMKAAFQPHWATAVGVSGHEGELARYTQRDLSRRLRRVFGIKRKLGSFVTDSLSITGWVDQQVLMSEIETFEYWFSGEVTWRRSPLPYTDAIIDGVMGLLLGGEEDSLSEHLASRLGAIPDVVADARTNVTDPMRLHCEVAAARLRAFLALLDPESLEGHPSVDAGVVTPEVLGAARQSVEAFAALADSLAESAGAEFTPGAENYSYYLKTAHMFEEPLDNLAASAQLVLDQAREKGGAFSPALCCEAIDPGDPAAREKAVSDYGARLAASVDLIETLGLLTLRPEDSLLKVRAAPFAGPRIEGALYRPPRGGTPGKVFLSFDAPPGAAADRALHPGGTQRLFMYYPAPHPAEVRLQENPSVVRRFLRSDIGRDGWQLYFAAAIAKPTPVDGDEQQAKWSNLAFWAASAIAEIKIHTGEMTLPEAAEFIAAQTGRDRGHALEDVRRYAVAPGTGIGYLLGRREILKLRERYKKAKRNSFDLKEFHDTLLSCGYLPPHLLSIEVMSKGMGRE